MIAEDYFLLQQAGGSSSSQGGIVGPVRPHRHGTTATRDLCFSFQDLTGPRRLVGFTWFCAVTDYHEFRNESEDVLAAAKAAGYTYVRNFRVLSYDWVDPWGPNVPNHPDSYFKSRGVSPVTGIERGLEFARACQRHGLGIQSSDGHDWNSTTERMRWEHEHDDTMKREGVLSVFKWKEGDNEYWLNATMKDSDQQIREYKRIYEEIVLPLGDERPLFACGAPENEFPSNIWRSIGRIQQPKNPLPSEPPPVILQHEFCDYGDIHTSRDDTPGIDETVKRPFSIGYNEGDVGMYHVPFAHSEPRPPVGPDAFSPSDKPGRLLAAYGMAQLWGGALTQFSGESVRGRSKYNDQMKPSNLLTADGFAQIPMLLDNLPQDVGNSTHVPGGNIWWWALPDGRIATSVSDLWIGNTLQPPVPIARSWIIGPNWETREIIGPPKQSDIAGQGGALIVAEPA